MKTKKKKKLVSMQGMQLKGMYEKELSQTGGGHKLEMIMTGGIFFTASIIFSREHVSNYNTRGRDFNEQLSNLRNYNTRGRDFNEQLSNLRKQQNWVSITILEKQQVKSETKYNNEGIGGDGFKPYDVL